MIFNLNKIKIYYFGQNSSMVILEISIHPSDLNLDITSYSSIFLISKATLCFLILSLLQSLSQLLIMYFFEFSLI